MSKVSFVVGSFVQKWHHSVVAAVHLSCSGSASAESALSRIKPRLFSNWISQVDAVLSEVFGYSSAGYVVPACKRGASALDTSIVL